MSLVQVLSTCEQIKLIVRFPEISIEVPFFRKVLHSYSLELFLLGENLSAFSIPSTSTRLPSPKWYNWYQHNSTLTNHSSLPVLFGTEQPKSLPTSSQLYGQCNKILINCQYICLLCKSWTAQTEA